MKTSHPILDTGFLHHKAGHEIPVRIRAIPVRNPHGSIIGAVEIFEFWANAYRATAKPAVAAFRNVLRVGDNRVLPYKVYFRKRLVTLALMFSLSGQWLGPVVG